MWKVNTPMNRFILKGLPFEYLTAELHKDTSRWQHCAKCVLAAKWVSVSLKFHQNRKDSVHSCVMIICKGNEGEALMVV